MLDGDGLLENFPHDDPRDAQLGALGVIESTPGNVVILEIPTGEGKTAIGVTSALTAAATASEGQIVFYVTPTKAQVDQVATLLGDRAAVLFGRSEYECLYYTDRDQQVTAQESPCYMLRCGHRVNQETGETVEEGATPCPYFQAKFDAQRRAKEDAAIVVTTTAGFLMNRMMVGRWREIEPALVVVDEVHRLAVTARRLFEYTVTDHSLYRALEALRRVDSEGVQTAALKAFSDHVFATARSHGSRKPVLIEAEELRRLVALLGAMDAREVERLTRVAVEIGDLDPLADREPIKALEHLSRNIPRMIRSIEFALPKGERNPLNFVVAVYYNDEDPEVAGTKRKVRTVLSLRSYYVRPLIQKALGERVVGYSATIGSSQMLGFETGLNGHFASFPSSFEAANSRVFLPTDTLDLAHSKQSRNTLRDCLKQIAKAVKTLAERGVRSLVVTVSDYERLKFVDRCKLEGIEAVSYGDGRTARLAARAFADGEGVVLVGTAGQYAEGIDLPGGIAPVIFFLRPSYPNPDDPLAQFETRRFPPSQLWALWQWRAVIEAMQVRGRNVRGPTDRGVCIFVSQQFRRFLHGALPAGLKSAYRGHLTLDASVAETLKLLGK